MKKGKFNCGFCLWRNLIFSKFYSLTTWKTLKNFLSTPKIYLIICGFFCQVLLIEGWNKIKNRRFELFFQNLIWIWCSYSKESHKNWPLVGKYSQGKELIFPAFTFVNNFISMIVQHDSCYMNKKILKNTDRKLQFFCE